MATGKFVLQICGWLIGIPLDILVIQALLGGAWRRYPLVFLYVAASFVTTLVEVPLNTESYLTGSTAAVALFAKVYWIDDWLLQFMIFAIVLSLIDRAMLASPWRRLTRIGLAAGALLFAGLSLWVHYRPGPKIGLWMTPWTRDLSVCATVLDLALWMILIATLKRDRSLLLISGALGVRFTGDAIGAAVAYLSMHNKMAAVALTGSVITMLADLACLYVWWQTFRPARNPVAVPVG